MLAIGLNYAEHAAESGFDVPDEPTVMFTKWPSCLTGPVTDVELPDGGRTDWEVELVAVIGRRAFRIGAGRRLGACRRADRRPGPVRAGLQRRGPSPQFSLAKSLPGFGPTGPWLVTPDEFDNPDDLELGCSVNGDQMQKGRTRDLIFSVPALLAALSRRLPLLPGDVLFTGTPAGVGLGRTPPRLARPGDELVSYIAGIGELRHAPLVVRHGLRPSDQRRLATMALHRLTQIMMGVPNVEQTAAYYAEFGLTPGADGAFATVDGGEQLRIVPAATRRLVQLGVGADDPDDLGRVAASLAALGVPVDAHRGRRARRRPGHPVAVQVEIAPRIAAGADPGARLQRPRGDRQAGQRAPGVLREQPVRPRKLGHVVIGSTDQQASQRFFHQGLGFKVSDAVPGLAAFMRCSTDHHNVLVQQAPVAFLHHTSWQVDDVDEVGRGASAMLAADPAGTCGAWAGTTSARTSSGTCGTRRATSPSTTPTSTASSTTPLWKPGVWEGARGLSSAGGRRHRLRSSPRRTSPP